MAFSLVEFDNEGGYQAVDETEMNEHLSVNFIEFTRTRTSEGKLDVKFSPLPYHEC